MKTIKPCVLLFFLLSLPSNSLYSITIDPNAPHGTQRNPVIYAELPTGKIDALLQLYQEWKEKNPEKGTEVEADLKKKFGRLTEVGGTVAAFLGNAAEDITKEQSQLSRFGNLAYYGAMYAAIPMTAVVLMKGAHVTLDVIKQKLLSTAPVILLAGSKYGRIDRLKRWWNNYKTPPMIFDQSVKERLEEIEEKTKNTRDHIRNGQKITYDNLLLYGKPGTGKTLFAQILADKTDMDFLPVTAASLLQSGVEGIKYFDELIAMANNSKYGVIIFVDEADALFVNRDSLSPDSDHYKVLNHILAATGSGSNKFMLIAATNHAYVMDPAMGRRFQDRVEMPLPDVATRRELLNIYMNEQLFNTKNRIPQFISVARTIITDAKINQIAQETAGLSHAEIKDMVTIMGKKANATKNGIITQRNVDSAVAEAIEKMKALERDKMELEKKTFHMRSQVQPQMRTDVVEEEGAAAAAEL